MKSLDKYISEAGGFFGNTRTTKNDSIMEWVYKYIFHNEKNIAQKYDIYNENDIINVLINYPHDYYIGEIYGPMLNGMPPVNLIYDVNKKVRELFYECEIKKFGVPLNIDDYDTIYLNQISSMVENPDIFNQTCKVINDCKSIKYVYFDLYDNSKVNKNTINYKSYDGGFKELKRNFKLISFNNALFHKIKFNQNIKVDVINIHKSDRKVELLPKIISLPVCKYLYFDYSYNYDEIIEMLSDYIPNPKLKQINITGGPPGLTEKKWNNIRNIILGVK